MESSANLGYTTHVLGTIRSVTECRRILVYNRNSFYNDGRYRRLTLYNLIEIYNNVLVDRSNPITGYNENCCVINRSIVDEEDMTNNPFSYDCHNVNTPHGFNIIIYLNYVNDLLSPVGFTEFVNTQGRISERIDIYLKFNVTSIQLELRISNSLYGIRDTLTKNFIGTALNEYTSNFKIDDDIKRVSKDSKYITHLSAYLNKLGKNNIYLNDRFLNSNKNLIKLDLIENFDFGLYTVFNERQLTYYGDDIVVYSWKYNENNQTLYQVVSATDGHSYLENNEMYGTVSNFDAGVTSQKVLYCAGKYIVFKVEYRNYNTKIKLFDTEEKTWVETIEDNVIIDPFDKEAEIIELPKSDLIQDLDSAYFLLPSLVNIHLNLKEYIRISRGLEVVRKIGDWFIIKNKSNGKTFYIVTNMFSSIYMTEEEYKNMIIINSSSLLLKENEYYIVYYGVRNKTYYTEKARSLKTNIGLTTEPNGGYLICNDDEAENYIDIYNRKEVDIVFKNSDLTSSIFNQFRRRPLKKYTVPPDIIGAIGGIIYYKENNNKLNYL